MNVLQSND